MAAATQDRDTKRRNGNDFVFPAKAATKIPAGVMVAIVAGLAVNAAAAGVVPGVARTQADNSLGADSDIAVEVERGCFAFGNSAGADEITRADIGKTCYVVDNQTVAKTDNSAARIKAGIVRDVDSYGVWVEF